MKRLLLVDHTGNLGGAEYILLDVARHYGPRCHVVLFADGPLRERLEAASIGVTVLQADEGLLGVGRGGGALRALASAPAVARMAWRLARIARGFDVLYPNSQKAAVVTMLVGQLVNRPVVWHLHDILSAEHFAATQRNLVVRLANATVRRVIVNSEATRAAFVACGGNPARVQVVLNGVDEAQFTGIEQFDPGETRRSLGLEGVKLVGLFGRLTPWKGQHVLVEALAALPGVHALMVGEALFGEDDYREQLRTQAARLGVADRVHWLGFRTDVPRLMRTVDVVVHASTSPEPFGLVIVEGMLAKRPVLATDHGASRELLGAEDAMLGPPSDAGHLAAAITRTLAMPPEQVRALTERNAERAQRLFPLRRMMLGIEGALDLPA